MNTKFCPECGNENMATAKFCMSCQNQFPNLPVVKAVIQKPQPKKLPQQVKQIIIDEEVQDDPDDNIELSDGESLINAMIDSLEAQKRLYSAKQGVKIEQVMGTDETKVGRKALPKRRPDKTQPRTAKAILKSTANKRREQNDD